MSKMLILLLLLFFSNLFIGSVPPTENSSTYIAIDTIDCG